MRSVFSFGLALLLLGSMLWGQCASCPLFKPVTTESHDCCQHEAPAKQPVHDDDRCPNDAVTPVTYSKAGLDAAHLLMPLATLAQTVVVVLPVPAPAPAPIAPGPASEHAPPDLCVLHSVFLV